MKFSYSLSAAGRTGRHWKPSLQLKITSKFSRNAKVTRALIGRRPVRPAAYDVFESYEKFPTNT